MISILGVRPGQLEIDVCPRDGVSCQGDNHLHLVPRGQHELVGAWMIVLLNIQISNFDGKLAGTFLLSDRYNPLR